MSGRCFPRKARFGLDEEVENGLPAEGMFLTGFPALAGVHLRVTPLNVGLFGELYTQSDRENQVGKHFFMLGFVARAET